MQRVESPASGAMPVEVVSVTGRRDHNEDVGIALAERIGEVPVALLLVADGMGGHAHGEVAARLAADALAEQWPRLLARLAEGPGDAEAIAREALRAGYAEAERRIASAGRGSGMGTTLVAAVIVGDGAILANVGDSRAYVVCDSGAALLTEDHSVVADAVRQGALTPEEAERSPFQHALTRALDGSGDPEPDLTPASGWLPLGASSTVLLCSDGLSGAVAEADLHAHIAGTPDLRGAARSLIALALERGTADNVTVALAEHGQMTRSGPCPMDPAHVDALLERAEAGPAPAAPLPQDAPVREVHPRETVGRTPWLLGGLAALLVLLALLLWARQREAPAASTLRGGMVPVLPAMPRPVPSAFDLAHEGADLRWTVTGIATRSDSVRVTVSFPADTLTRTLTTVGTRLPLADVAEAWPGGVLPAGAYVWRVEARSLSGSRLRSGAAHLILERPFPSFGDSRP